MMNRRNALATTGAGLAAALTGFAAHAAKPAAPKTSPAMAAASQALADARAELEAAREARDWLAAEWRHVWPLAPEALLGGTNAHESHCGNAERDILGNFLFRDTSDLTTRLNRQQRENLPRTCFHIDQSADLAERLERLTARGPEGRTDRARARDAKYRAEQIASLSERLPLALAYEADTAHVREASGIEGAIALVELMQQAVAVALANVMQTPVANVADLAAKAEVILADFRDAGVDPVRFGSSRPMLAAGTLSRDILAMTEA